MSPELPPPAISCAVSSERPLASEYDQARVLRLAGDYDGARAALSCVLTAEPENADAWLELALVELATGNAPRARSAFLHVLEIAPDYDDAKYGLARLAHQSGDLEGARTWLASVARVREDDPDAEALRAALGPRAFSAVGWRWDAAIAYSWLSAGLAPWREGSISASRRTGKGGVGAGVEYNDRFNTSDVYGEVRFARRLQTGTLELAVGGAPDAEFRPQAQVRAEFTTAEIDDWVLDGSVTLARYNVGEVDRLGVGAERGLGDWRAQARGIVVRDEIGDFRSGYGAGAAWRRGDGPEFTLAWTAAPEGSEGVTVDVESTALTVAFNLSQNARLRAALVREERNAFDRTELSFAFTRTF